MMKKIHIKKGKLGFKLYNLRCPYCGNDHHIPYWKIRLKFLIKGETQWHHHCTRCHKTTTKKMMFNIVNDHTDKDERKMNGKKLWDDRIQ